MYRPCTKYGSLLKVLCVVLVSLGDSNICRKLIPFGIISQAKLYINLMKSANMKN